jgi:hypothetical protein
VAHSNFVSGVQAKAESSWDSKSKKDDGDSAGGGEKKKRGKKDKGGEVAAKSDEGSKETFPARVPPPSRDMLKAFISGVCVCSISAAIWIEGADLESPALATLVGRTLVFYGASLQLLNLGPSTSGFLTMSACCQAVGCAAILNAVQLESTSYGAFAALQYVPKAISYGQWTELHFYVITAVRMLVAIATVVPTLWGTKDIRQLVMLTAGLLFFGPSGVGWVWQIYTIDTTKMLVYSYLAHTLVALFASFSTGAPGFIVLFTLGRGLCYFHDVDLNKVFGSA